MSKLYDALIVGGGPAGLSVALGLARVHRTCVVFSDGTFRNKGVKAAHSIITRDHVHPQEIRDLARRDVEKYGNTRFEETAITIISKTNETFVAQNEAGEAWRGRAVVLATGVKDVFPDLPGYAENWPESIYQCLFCDGHERSHLPMGMLCYPEFNAPFATHILHLMKGLSRSLEAKPKRPDSQIILFTNGAANRDDQEVVTTLEQFHAEDINIDHRPVLRLIPHKENEEPGLDVIVKNEDGTEESIALGFLAHKPRTTLVAPHLAEQLGVETEQGMFGTFIKTTPPFFSTNVPGVFSAGDAGVQMTHISNAMLTGNAVAGGLAHYVGRIEAEEAMGRWMAKKAGDVNGEGVEAVAGCSN